MFKLLKDCDVYAPHHLGRQDILVCGERIVHMAATIDAPHGIGSLEICDCAGLLVVPGLLDQHVHLIGGGGEGGPATRTPEVQLSEITTAGVTTVVGCLGTDGTTRHVATLLAKARALELEGLTTYIYTGAYQVPTPTITGNVRDDIIFIDKIIGVGEIAISDHRSAAPSPADVLKLAAMARVGGMLAKKPGLCHLHVGSGKQGLNPLFAMLEMSEIPIHHFIPTHCDRTPELVNDAIRFAKMGGRVDLTAGSRTAETCIYMLEMGTPLENITFSSDGNGSLPRFNRDGVLVGLAVASLQTTLGAVRKLVLVHGWPLEDALRPVTTNVAHTLELVGRKGTVAIGADADLVVLDRDLQVCSVFARGQKMVWEGQVLVKGTFEQ